MISTWARTALVGCLLAIPSAVLSQTRTEIGLQGIVATADPVAVTGGAYGGAWVERRLRLVGTAGLGVQDSDLAWRLEGLAHFHFNPGATGLGVYGGGGLALAGGADTQGYIVVLVGIETAPAGSRGWSLELGVGEAFGLGSGIAGGSREGDDERHP